MAHEDQVNPVSLPPDLQAAIAAWLEAQPSRGSRRAASAALSDTFRSGGSSQAIDLASYLVARLPATFAAVDHVLGELAVQRPGFAPESMLDAGSGPGTASWAAAGVWPSLAVTTFLDNAPEFLRLAQGLARGGPPPVASARALPGDIAKLPEGLGADLVVAAYALAEMPEASAAAVACRLWQSSRQMLVLVEPGTPKGFARIRAARAALLEKGAVPVAPCTHAEACPVAGEDWCHFSVRLARSRAHMHAKSARVPFEDEKFAYVILAREGAVTGGARILSPPGVQKPGIDLKLCVDGRIERRMVQKRDAAAFRAVRRLGWGDLFKMETEEEST